ncbi:high affinity cationic amino acid transporter 1-like [Amphiura filiformis]|uniref:high affinity cationic amino acid transporter 1-like n=1 Tax=Amphiura filiformis TaxID=82378 RepID=UPI003B2113E8
MVKFCDSDSVHKCSKLWDIMMHSLCRTKRIRHVMAPPDDSHQWTCFPLELARLGIANGSYLTAGVFLVVGYVAGDVAGPSTILSLVIAAFVSLLTGLCYAEYISHHPASKTSVTSPQYFYILSGEFTGTIIGWIQLCFYTASGAAFARAISATFDYLIDNAVSNLTKTIIDKNSNVPNPDFLAGGIVMLIIVVVIFGGKVLECFTVTFSVLTLIILIPLTILSGMYGSPENWTENGGFFPFKHTGVFAGSAICVFLFGGYDVIATASKDKSRDFRVIGIAILSSIIVNLIALLILAVFMTLLVPYATLVNGRPLPTVFFQYGGHWGKIFIGLTAMFCLGSAVMNSISCLVYTTYLMGADGLIPRSCATINKRTSTPVIAAVVTGIICVLMAIIVEFGLLLEIVAISVLAHQTGICAATMATRYRPLEDDDDDNGVEEMNTSSTKSSKPKKKVKRKRSPRSGVPSSANGKSHTTPFYDDSDSESSLSDDDDDDKDNDDTDIDVMVEEYREKMRRAKQTHIEGPNNKKPPKSIPTIFTSTLAAASTILIVIWCVAIGAILNRMLPYLLGANPWVICSLTLFVCLLVITTIVLVLQPRREVVPAFRIPLFPVIPVIGIAINVFLLFSVSDQAWIVFGIWIIQGLCFYFCYGINHSVESRRYACQAPEEELVLLQPLPEQPLHEQLLNAQGHDEQNIGYQRYHESK